MTSTDPGPAAQRLVAGVDGPEGGDAALAWALRQATEVLAKAVATATAELPVGSPVTVTTSLVQGHPTRELLRAAAGADLLVVGPRRHGELSGMLLTASTAGPVPDDVVSEPQDAAALEGAHLTSRRATPADERPAPGSAGAQPVLTQKQPLDPGSWTRNGEVGGSPAEQRRHPTSRVSDRPSRTFGPWSGRVSSISMTTRTRTRRSQR